MIYISNGSAPDTVMLHSKLWKCILCNITTSYYWHAVLLYQRFKVIKWLFQDNNL